MPFVNPLDLLCIPPSAPAPDADTLRKARRGKMLEFDLSDDGAVEHEGKAVTRADFQRACDDLDDPRKLAGYRALQRLPSLTSFLSGGPPQDLQTPLPDWAAHPALVELLSPPFVERYAPALASAVRKGDAAAVRALTARPPLVSDRYLPDLYAEADEALSDIVRELNRIERGIEEDEFDNAGPDLVLTATKLVSPQTLNGLPDHFEGGRSRVAQALRSLAVTAFNELDDVSASLDLIRKAAGLKANPTTAERIRADVEQIEGIHHRRRLTEEHAWALKAAAEAVVKLQALAKRAGQEYPDLEAIRKQAEGLVKAEQLNRLPEEVAGPREVTALTLRAIALTAWNEHDDAATALALTRLALTLKVGGDVSKRLREDLTTLEQMARESEAHAEREAVHFLALLEQLRRQTRGGLFEREVDWDTVENLLDGLLTKGGGLRVLRSLKNTAKKKQITDAFWAVIERLQVRHPVGASRIAQRLSLVAPGSRPSQFGAPSPAAKPASPAPSRPASPGSRAPAAPPQKPPQRAPDYLPQAEPEGGAGSTGLVVLGVFMGVLFLFALIVTSGGSGGGGSVALSTALGDTMRVVVSAAHGPVSGIRITLDQGVRRPYWIERGDEMSFAFTDTIVLENYPDDVQVTVNGREYPTARDGQERLVITRASVQAVLNGGTPLGFSSPSSGRGPQEAEPVADPLEAAPVRLPYEGNQLANGASPYDAYFGRGVYNDDSNAITFRNGQGSDAVVLLIEYSSGRTIRNEYIRAGSSFEMTNVPSGTYYIRASYGRDWNPTLPLGDGRVLGGFETDRAFSESRHDPLTLTDDGYTYDSYEVTLYKVDGGNMGSSPISDASFFN